jgi:hypothetical protein
MAQLISFIILWAIIVAACSAHILRCYMAEVAKNHRLADEQLWQQGLHRLPYESDEDALRRAWWAESRRSADNYQQWIEDSGVVDVSDVDPDADTIVEVRRA